MYKRDRIRDMLTVSPFASQRVVAKALGVSPGYVHHVKKEMSQRRGGRYVTSLGELLDEGSLFPTLLIDPPWAYSNQGTRGATSRPKKFHYHTMSVDELKALPVQALAATDAHLYLWTTVAFQEISYVLMRAWGFEPKSQAIWCKKQLGLGNTFRISHEILLLGVRGQALTFRHKGLRSWFICGRGRHSEKPDQVRAWIEAASPAPRLELFGRRAVPGWVVFGDQCTYDLFSQEGTD